MFCDLQTLLIGLHCDTKCQVRFFCAQVKVDTTSVLIKLSCYGDDGHHDVSM